MNLLPDRSTSTPRPQTAQPQPMQILGRKVVPRVVQRMHLAIPPRHQRQDAQHHSRVFTQSAISLRSATSRKP